MKLPSSSFGYTLIELLVTLTIVSLLFGFGYANYRGFARNQALVAAARVVKADLRLAQGQALAGKKPVGCDVLDGYYFRWLSSASYRIEASCLNGDYPLKTVDNVFDGTTISVPSPNPILFKVLGKGTNVAEGSPASLSLERVGVENPLVVTVTSAGEIK